MRILRCLLISLVSGRARRSTAQRPNIRRKKTSGCGGKGVGLVCYGEQEVENIGFDYGIAQGGESGLCEFPFAEAGN